MSTETGNDTATISEVIGTPDTAHRIVRVGDWSLTVPGAEGTEPEIPDTELAPRLGMHLHNLRKLSGRYEHAGHIRPRVEISPTVEGTPESQRNPGGRPARRRFYTEADALFLVTRSEAPGAVGLTKEMIRVYMAARRGLLSQQRAPAAPTLDAEMLRKMVALLVAEQLGKTRPAALESPVLGSLDRETVLLPLVRLARTTVGPEASRTQLACARTRIDGRIRTRLGWRTRWSLFPRNRLGELLAALQAETLYAEDVAEGVASVRRNSIRAVR